VVILKDGPVSSIDILKAAEEEDISERTLHRVKKLLQIKTKKIPGFGGEGGWEWEL
jgi:hypothetical protein